ncbi:Retrovirus-related Pol polyprotein [Thelohanellus kitauei]|uniref:Retrovirus-related Pol polyprotein n=1 Tax=Thelohanellus kitauei TaxID=669202 RepID=A0A0C2ITY8_THEKT|nr:Retrovirus-related Pol polyprotein [Thelohanellus kitauei]
MVERFNRTIKNSLSKLVQYDNEWDVYLQAVTFSYNVSKHEATSISPFEILFKPIDYLPIDAKFQTDHSNFDQFTDEKIAQILETARHNIQKSVTAQSMQYNKKINELDVRVGDRVFLFVPVDNEGGKKIESPLERRPHIKIDIDNKCQRVHGNRCKIAFENTHNSRTPEEKPVSKNMDADIDENNDFFQDQTLRIIHLNSDDHTDEPNNQPQVRYSLRPREDIRKPLRYCQGDDTDFSLRERNVTRVTNI